MNAGSWPASRPIRWADPEPDPNRSGAVLRLQLLGKFGLFTASRRPVPVGASCQRLLALVALNDGQVGRRRVSGLLWPDVTAERANANLRSVLWRLQQSSVHVLKPSSADLRLATCVDVDLQRLVTVARRLIDLSAPIGLDQLSAALRSNLYEDLLPDMDDDWLIAERTRYRQLRLHTLEALSERLIEVRWFGAAVDAGLAAVRADPFRESAHKTLIRAYLAEGNQNDAYEQFRVYESTLRKELGLEPSEQLHRLLETTGQRRTG
jgi:DNA-binding SARP family transcriptional activator